MDHCARVVRNSCSRARLQVAITPIDCLCICDSEPTTRLLIPQTTMTTTDAKSAERCVATLVGTPFSTFTRTIAMGLIEKEVPFEQLAVLPHSDTAKKSHPFGRIPSFCDASGFWIFESVAISRYIDSYTGKSLRPADARNAALMDQFVSTVSNYAFAGIEHGVIKKRVALSESKASEQEIGKALEPGLMQSHEALAVLEKLTDATGPFVLG